MSGWKEAVGRIRSRLRRLWIARVQEDRSPTGSASGADAQVSVAAGGVRAAGPVGRSHVGTEFPAASAERDRRRDGTPRSAGSDSAGVDAGESTTQFPERRPEEIERLVLGLDFGTSCTKVVIRSPFALGSRAVAVPWLGRNGDSSYLLPTVLHENGRGELDCVPLEDTRVRHTDLKIRLLNRGADDDARARAAAYLGRALRKARRWCLASQRDAWGRSRLRWMMNVGIPSAGYDDEAVRKAFKEVAQAAWRLSLRRELPTVDVAVNALRVNDRELDEIEAIEVVPEIAAEVVGYARSRRRKNGLHVMVDVGASTVDICGFILHAPDGDDCYELLTALVERLGVHELHLRRIRAIEEEGARMRPSVPTALDPFAAIPYSASEYVDNPTAFLRRKLARVDEEYVGECTRALMLVLMELKKRRYPWWFHHNSTEPLPLFVAGGGGWYKRTGDVVEQARERFTPAVYGGGIDRKSLPALDGVDVPRDMAGRIDVACGLSFVNFEIGRITRPGEIDDADLRVSHTQPEAITKDQV